MIHERIRKLEALLEQEKEPNMREHYVNVLKQLQIMLEQL